MTRIIIERVAGFSETQVCLEVPTNSVPDDLGAFAVRTYGILAAVVAVETV